MGLVPSNTKTDLHKSHSFKNTKILIGDEFKKVPNMKESTKKRRTNESRKQNLKKYSKNSSAEKSKSNSPKKKKKSLDKIRGVLNQSFNSKKQQNKRYNLDQDSKESSPYTSKNLLEPFSIKIKKRPPKSPKTHQKVINERSNSHRRVKSSRDKPSKTKTPKRETIGFILEKSKKEKSLSREIEKKSNSSNSPRKKNEMSYQNVLKQISNIKSGKIRDKKFSKPKMIKFKKRSKSPKKNLQKKINFEL